MQVLMTVLNGAEQNRVLHFPAGSCLTVGRGSDADRIVCREDKFVSALHVVVDTTESCRLIALASTNHPHVNGVEIRQAFLNHGDVIEMGYTRLLVSIEADEPMCMTCDISLRRSDGDHSIVDPDVCWLYACPKHVPRDSEYMNEEFRGYQICRRLGEGGMGTVFLAYEPRRYRLLALKHIKQLQGDQQMRRFLHEMIELRSLRHPNIVRFVDSDFDAHNRPFLVTELTPDGDLYNWVMRNGPMDKDTALDLASGILDGFECVHAQGDVHRDMKPQNVLLKRSSIGNTRRFIPKVADFGLVKSLLRASGSRVTEPLEIGGSLKFMAPEQATRFSDLDSRADIYAIGATLYFALTGEAMIDIPKDTDDSTQLQLVAEGPRIPIRKRRPDICSAVEAVIERACAVDPARRFQSVKEFRAQVHEARN